jgi:hypothetical protein
MLKYREASADVVEHAIEQNLDAAIVRGADEGVEVGLVTEARIDPEDPLASFAPEPLPVSAHVQNATLSLLRHRHAGVRARWFCRG